MSQLQVFNGQFGELPVIIVDGVEWFGATEAATALSFSKPHDAISNHVDGDDSAVHRVTDSLGRNQNKKFINESGLYGLIFGAAKQGNNSEIREKARAYKKWVTGDVLPTIRKTGGYLLESEQKARYSEPALIHFKKEVYILEAACDILRLPESGKLKLLGDFSKQHQLNVPLPAYAVNEDITESATVLLKKNNAPFGAAKFNTLLIQHGLLEERERPSSKGGVKMFKSLTEAGLKYGKNIISPANPRETQPHYYANKFSDLLDLIKIAQ